MYVVCSTFIEIPVFWFSMMFSLKEWLFVFQPESSWFGHEVSDYLQNVFDKYLNIVLNIIIIIVFLMF